MSWSKITLIGFEQWLNAENKSLFDGLRLPEGIDKDILCYDIITQAGEFEVLYANPDIMQAYISKWGLKWYRTFQKWFEALSLEYEPLYNYDRYEEWTDKHEGEKTFNGSVARIGGATDTNDLTQTNDLTRTDDLLTATNTDMTTEQTRSAMDSSTYQPLNKEQVTGDEDDNTVSNTGTVKDTGTVKNTGTVKRSETESTTTGNAENETLDITHNGHLYGNIGVTTSMQLLKEQLDIVEWNLYDHITDLFIKEFCIPVYE